MLDCKGYILRILLKILISKDWLVLEPVYIGAIFRFGTGFCSKNGLKNTKYFLA